MAHRRAKLTPYGRSVLVDRVLIEGWSVGEVAKAASVSPATVYKWLARFRDEGVAGLQDRSSAPTRCPRALSPSEVRRILAGRRRLKVGPHRLAPMLGHPRSTVYGVLRRAGLSRLAHLDRPTAMPLRYERERPGELLHVDVKKLGRIRPGGGWRMLGQSSKTKAPRAAEPATTTSTPPSTTTRATPTSRSTPMNGERPAPGSSLGPPLTSESSAFGSSA